MLAKLTNINTEQPVLIAGPTASGKSALAMEIAGKHGGVIINADALQVFSDWRVLTARPTLQDEAVFPHQLYGHVPGDTAYSVGQWLRDVTPILAGQNRPIIVGGTGLYFTALSEGLADIPNIPPDIRTIADQRMVDDGYQALLAELDPETTARIDTQNPVRVQRAWEVLAATGRGIAAWQDETPAPILPLADTQPILLSADKEWLNQRIAQRFDKMLANGALDEARTNRDTWLPNLPSAKAIGASELMAYLGGNMTLEQARDSATIATRQYAKRQRSWFRARMKSWNIIELPS